MVENQILKAVELLRQGNLVAFPTDTVYGLGADARNEQAILKVFELKQRPFDRPLIVHIPNLEHLAIWANADYLKQDVFKLVEIFWPGPLTIVVKKSSLVSDLITAGQDNIAIRIPNHPIALELLKTFDSGIVGTSANLSGNISNVTGKQVAEEFNNIFILDDCGAGCSKTGVGSTIISLVAQPVILRQGAIKTEQLRSCLGRDVLVRT
jgi:L-threonylcarbamoyladenylate synthase